MDKFPKEYFPSGPSSSAKVRNQAKIFLNDLMSDTDILNNKSLFFQQTERLTARILGLDDKTAQDYEKQTNESKATLGVNSKDRMGTKNEDLSHRDHSPHDSSEYIEKMKIFRRSYIPTNERPLLFHANDSTVRPRHSSKSTKQEITEAMKSREPVEITDQVTQSVNTQDNAPLIDSHNDNDIDILVYESDEKPDSDDDDSESVIEYELSIRKHVRVLWDLENITVSKKQGGMTVVTKLHEFLRDRDLMGPGIDTRITGFFNPEVNSISNKTVQELDKAGIELVWVSTKLEDADRKLGNRIAQEIQVLKDINNTIFVIISSDQDFRHYTQLLHNIGYTVIIIHNAPPGKWRQALELYATYAYKWFDDVLGITGTEKIGKKSTVSMAKNNIENTQSKKESSATPDATIKAMATGAKNESIVASMPTNVESNANPAIDSKPNARNVLNNDNHPTGKQSKRRKPRGKSPTNTGNSIEADQNSNLHEVTDNASFLNNSTLPVPELDSNDRFTSPNFSPDMSTTIATVITTESMEKVDNESAVERNILRSNKKNEPSAKIIAKETVQPESQQIELASLVSRDPPLIKTNKKLEINRDDERSQGINHIKSEKTLDVKSINIKKSSSPLRNTTDTKLRERKSDIPRNDSLSDTVDLSNLTFQKLKDLTGHY